MRTGAQLALFFGIVMFGAIVAAGYMIHVEGIHDKLTNTIAYFLFMTFVGAIIGLIGSFLYWLK